MGYRRRRPCGREPWKGTTVVGVGGRRAKDDHYSLGRIAMGGVEEESRAKQIGI